MRIESKMLKKIDNFYEYKPVKIKQVNTHTKKKLHYGDERGDVKKILEYESLRCFMANYLIF